jgi:hypothetical protein
MDYLFAAAAGASERVMVEREEARDRTVEAIRELEGRVREAILGDTLRGMANLNPAYGGTPVQGMRVVDAAGDPDAKVRPGRRALILGKDGEFLVFEVMAGGAHQLRKASDGDFLAQDLDAVTHTVRTALERHIRRADRTVENYERLTSLAATLVEALTS